MATNNIPKPDRTVNGVVYRWYSGAYRSMVSIERLKLSAKIRRKYVKENQEKMISWRILNKEKRKQYDHDRYWSDPEKAREKSAKQRLKHKKRKSDYVKRYHKNRLKTDIEYKLKSRLRIRINQLLKSRNEHSVELLGCSPPQWRIHLESKFKDKMTWENYGHGAGCWTIDHIIPLALFDLKCPLARRMAFGFENTQPMWSSENYSKQHRKSSLS